MGRSGDPRPSWQPPSPSLLAAARRLVAPWRFVTAPRFIGAARVPRQRPVMFVANHTLLGMIDTPLLFLGIHEHTGHFPRSMGDHIHFRIPGWRDLLTRFGAVRGTREHCRTVMRQGYSLVVYPGGGREVFKRRGEAYQLLWGQRAGFARLAVEHRYPIVPVAAVGAEECYRIRYDQNDLMRTPFGPEFVKRAPRNDVAFPTIATGLAGTLLPIPQRFYFAFGDPIESAPYGDQEDVGAASFALREEVRVALERLIAELLAVRENDPRRAFWPRVLRRSDEPRR